PQIITTDAQLHSLCDRLAQAGCFAFDTEFIMEAAYQSIVCLIQTATHSEVTLIDPLSGLNTEPFWDLVTDPSVEVVLHAAAEDLALCQQVTGKTPANVFDVQVAAGLVSRDYPLSLGRLVQSMLGVRLHKTQTLTDWRRRPLTDAQRMYAVEDVAYLPAIHRLLVERLQEDDRLDWAREEFARFESPATYEPPKQDRLRRLKGTGSLDRRGLAVASELLEVRDRLAQEYNRPARAVLRDHLLIEIARHRWTLPQKIRSLRGLHLRATAIEQLAEAVKRGSALPREQWPVPPVATERSPREVVLATLVTAVLRDACLAHEISFGLTANKQSVEQLVHANTRSTADVSPLSRGWRASLLGPMLSDVLHGRAVIRVMGDGRDTRLEVKANDRPKDTAGPASA
ncbi:MAG: ribonuclease D, partial [Planctomycetota bacterium]